MALATAVGADGGLMVMVIAAAFDDVVSARLSVTLNWNEPAVVLPVVGTKVRSPALSAAAVMTWPDVIAVPLRASVPSLGSVVTVTLPSVSVATAVGADGGLMVMVIAAAFDDVVSARLSVTLNWNEPAVVLPVVGTKVRSP